MPDSFIAAVGVGFDFQAKKMASEKNSREKKIGAKIKFGAKKVSSQ